MRLLAVELTRLRWRRAVLLILAAAVILPACIWAATAWNTRPPSAEDVARAEAEIAAMVQEPWFDEEVARCAERPEEWGLPTTGDAEAECRRMMTPTVEDHLWRPTLDLRGELTATGPGVIALLCGLMLLVGTTFVGHDWNTGSMANQLLFEPRRLRVWLTKAAAVLLVGLALGAVVVTAYWTGLVALADARDLPHGPAVMDEVRLQVVRGVLVVGAAGVLGYALTNLFRSTVATLGVVFVVAIAGSFVLTVFGGPEAQRWMFHANLWAVLQDGYSYWVEDPSCMLPGSREDCGRRTITALAGSTYLGLSAAVVGALSVWSFRRRDVP